MTKGLRPGVMLAIIGLALFAYQGLGVSLHSSVANGGASTRRVQRASLTRPDEPNDQTFPATSVLAGILFMSGVGLAAISANPALQSQPKKANG